MRASNTYRAAKRNATLRRGRRTGEFVPEVRAHHPHAKDVVAQLLREWLMRGWRMYWHKGLGMYVSAPPVKTGPSRHGKCIVATHLNIAKAKVIEARRPAKTGISCEPRPSMSGSTSAWQMYPRHRYGVPR